MSNPCNAYSNDPLCGGSAPIDCSSDPNASTYVSCKYAFVSYLDGVSILLGEAQNSLTSLNVSAFMFLTNQLYNYLKTQTLPNSDVIPYYTYKILGFSNAAGDNLYDLIYSILGKGSTTVAAPTVEDGVAYAFKTMSYLITTQLSDANFCPLANCMNQNAFCYQYFCDQTLLSAITALQIALTDYNTPCADTANEVAKVVSAIAILPPANYTNSNATLLADVEAAIEALATAFSDYITSPSLSTLKEITKAVTGITSLTSVNYNAEFLAGTVFDGPLMAFFTFINQDLMPSAATLNSAIPNYAGWNLVALSSENDTSNLQSYLNILGENVSGGGALTSLITTVGESEWSDSTWPATAGCSYSVPSCCGSTCLCSPTTKNCPTNVNQNGQQICY